MQLWVSSHPPQCSGSRAMSLHRPLQHSFAPMSLSGHPPLNSSTLLLQHSWQTPLSPVRAVREPAQHLNSYEVFSSLTQWGPLGSPNSNWSSPLHDSPKFRKVSVQVPAMHVPWPLLQDKPSFFT